MLALANFFQITMESLADDEIDEPIPLLSVEKLAVLRAYEKSGLEVDDAIARLRAKDLPSGMENAVLKEPRETASTVRQFPSSRGKANGLNKTAAPKRKP